jgi:hypothetical protein
MSLSYYNYNGNPITGSFQLINISIPPATPGPYNTGLSINDYNVMVAGFSLDGSPASVGFFIGSYYFYSKKNNTTNTWVIYFSGENTIFYVDIVLLVIPTNTGLFNSTATYSIGGPFLYDLSFNSNLVATGSKTSYYPAPMGFSILIGNLGVNQVVVGVEQDSIDPTLYDLYVYSLNATASGNLNYLLLSNSNIFNNSNYKINDKNLRFETHTFTDIGIRWWYDGYNTGYSTADWVVCVVGFQINYTNNAHYYWQCFASQNSGSGTWYIYTGDFYDGSTGPIDANSVTVF